MVMHLPFIQVTNEAVDLVAAEVAVVLEADELAILGGLVRFYRWALQRCPDHLPPSASDVVTGPHAAKLIARAAGYRGDPEAYVAACASASKPSVERVEGGVRIRGLDRYDAAWAKNHPDLWKQWRQSRSETGAEPVRNRSETGPESDRQTQTQTQTNKKQLPPPTSSVPQPPSLAPPSTAEAAEAEMRGDGDGGFPLTPFGFYGWTQHARRERGLTQEGDPPQTLMQWNREAVAEVGPAALCRAYERYLGDAHFSPRGWPIRVFMSDGVWRSRTADPPPKVKL